MKYDLAIIGAGPAGYVAAKKAAGNGLKVLFTHLSKFGNVYNFHVSHDVLVIY